jgi:leader peptidase (prepilin peptidase)/N-methyltransferase
MAEWAAGASLVTVARERFVVAAAMSAMIASLWWAGWAQLGVTPTWLAWCWACALGCSPVCVLHS